MTTLCRTLLTALALTFLTAPAFGYITKENDTLAVEDRTDLPQRGTPVSRVLQRFGEPMTRHAAVGDPPISRWDYPGFSVYFEHDLALHSVVIKNGEPPVRAK